LCAFDSGSVVGFKDSQAGVEQFAFGDDDDIEPSGHLVPTIDLSNQTFSAVSLDRAAKLSSSGNPQPARWTIGRQKEERTVAAVNPMAALIHLLKFWSPANPLVGTKPHGPANPLFAAHRQAFTALRTPAFEHQPAILRTHTNQKAVRPLAMARIRLKRALPLH
jgi:hypothetical protein